MQVAMATTWESSERFPADLIFKLISGTSRTFKITICDLEREPRPTRLPRFDVGLWGAGTPSAGWGKG
jgi:hypothetical protein